jgi:two-component system, cell cycle response regulator
MIVASSPGRRLRSSLGWAAMPVGVRVLLGVLAAGTAIEAVHYTTPLLGWIGFHTAIYDAVLFGAAALCVAGAAIRRTERLAWTLMGVALALWASGELYWTFALADLEEAPFPSIADALWLGFLPVAYVSVVLLVRQRIPHVDSRLWLDGVIAALTTGALSAAIVFAAVKETTGGDTAAVATNLAYPLGDMILIGIVIGAMTAGRGRLDRTWLCFGAGVGVFAVADSVYLFQVAEDTYVTDRLLDIGWPLGALLIALAAWQPATRNRRRAEKRPSVIVPVALSLVSLGILVYDHFERTNLLALALATASIVAMVVRLYLTHRESLDNLATSRRQARTDALTGLANRFALMGAIEGAIADGTPHVLLLFDLDGFKNYNDSYGHPAGDALLARLGSRLVTATAADGGAYRIGGDEFCVLAELPDGAAPDSLVERSRAALCEEGDGFKVGASCGHALIPGEAPDAAEAMRVADRRLYAEKNSGRISARIQSTQVLRRALEAWDAELGEHTGDVAELAAQVARRLGLDDDEVERIATAAELHDVGKIAIPRSILTKPAALDEEEWAFMRRHTLIGERIAQGAPALVGVAGLIRSSHERWDGAGYPDGLAGDAIPLGAQILFVCDSFSAMTTDRVYKAGMSEAEAIEELRRHAGTQFAPAVVDAFEAAHAAPLQSAA